MTKFVRIAIVFLLSAVPATLGAQSLAVKTNMLYWGTATPNLGFEAALGRNVTLNVSGGYTSLTFEETDGVKQQTWEHYLINAEARWWSCNRFDGMFFGVQGFYGDYKVEDLPLLRLPKKYRYEGIGYGAGVVMGNHWAVGRRWGIELSAGVGVMLMEYDRKQNGGYNTPVTGRFNQTYFGPTKLSVSFMYFIK